MWYEFKSTSNEQHVMTREHFCGVRAGPRTVFVIEVFCGYWIEKFSAFQGLQSEFEVLLPPLSEFEVVGVVKQIIDPKETSSLEKSGFPDVIQLKQINVRNTVEERKRAKEEQEQKDAELAKALQHQLLMEEEEEAAAKKMDEEAAAAAKKEEATAAKAKDEEATAAKNKSDEAAAAAPKKEEGLAGGYRKGDRVMSLIAHGKVQKGDVGTVVGPCADNAAADKTDRVHVDFGDDKGRMNVLVESQIERA